MNLSKFNRDKKPSYTSQKGKVKFISNNKSNRHGYATAEEVNVLKLCTLILLVQHDLLNLTTDHFAFISKRCLQIPK